MDRRWLALAGFLILVAGSGIWLEAPWHQGNPVAPTSGPTTGHAGSCQLPVFVIGSEVAGFLTVPGYAFSQAHGTVLSGGSRSSDGRWSYDAPLHKWVPVDFRYVSKDGLWWIYQTPMTPSISAPASIHLVDRHGTDRTVWSGHGLALLYGWTSRGAVFENLAPGAKSADLWLFDPAAGALQRLPQAPGSFAGLDSTGLWGMADRFTADPSDKSAPLRWTLSRTDISSGRTVTWWDHLFSGLVQVIAMDSHDRPLVYVYPDGADPGHLYLLTGPGTEVELSSSTSMDQFDPISALGDDAGIWFGEPRDQVWRWTPGDGLRMVTQVPNVPDATYIVIAGPCR